METYKLVDGIAMNKLHPSTFEIPSEEDKANIVIGDYVKIGFLTKRSDCKIERMWIKITSITNEEYTGVLDNDPVVAMYLSRGQMIKFKKENILSTYLNK